MTVEVLLLHPPRNWVVPRVLRNSTDIIVCILMLMLYYISGNASVSKISLRMDILEEHGVLFWAGPGPSFQSLAKLMMNTSGYSIMRLLYGVIGYLAAHECLLCGAIYILGDYCCVNRPRSVIFSRPHVLLALNLTTGKTWFIKSVSHS